MRVVLFVLGINAMWTIGLALILTKMMEKGWTTTNTKALRNGFAALGGLFLSGAVVARMLQ